jgi:hypothetical protein
MLPLPAETVSISIQGAPFCLSQFTRVIELMDNQAAVAQLSIRA